MMEASHNVFVDTLDSLDLCMCEKDEDEEEEEEDDDFDEADHSNSPLVIVLAPKKAHWFEC